MRLARNAAPTVSRRAAHGPWCPDSHLGRLVLEHRHRSGAALARAAASSRGNSLGDHNATYYMTAHPERVISAALIASSNLGSDITTLGRHGLIKSAGLRRRAEKAMENYVGNLDTLKGAINLACRIVEDAEQRNSA